MVLQNVSLLETNLYRYFWVLLIQAPGLPFMGRNADVHIQCLHAVCQGHFDRLDLRDMRGLLDDAAGKGGSCDAALPEGRGGARDAHPVNDIGPCNGKRPPAAGAAQPCSRARC